MRTEFGLIPRALRHTVPRLLTAKGDNDASVLKVVLENAKVDPFGLALEMGDERYTWSALDDKTSQVAHVLSAAGVRKGDVVALIATNSPLYLAIVWGVNRLGATTALVNSNLEGAPLSHAVRSSKARVVIVERKCEPAFRSRLDLKDHVEKVYTFNSGDFEERLAEAPARAFPRVPMMANEDYVFIYTSGTTGLPKPCRVTHGRAVVAGSSFGPLFFGFKPGDKLYNVLPLYHSNALLLGVGGCILTRTPVAMRSSFSAKAFWEDVQRYNATAMIYIGELCRYLLNTPPSDAEVHNPIRVALGNGLRADVWEPFQKRFNIPEIREFYGATEAPGIIVNLSGRQGSVGRVPFRPLSHMTIVRYDVDRDDYVRDSNGFCIECRTGEIGELLIRLDDEPRSAASEFRGYTDAGATEKKIVRNVFEANDRYYRSGDLMRYDEEDYFYFVDRIGDTYRWKGENVSTAEVADVLSKAPGVKETTVCGIQVPGMEGQAGLAAVVCENGFDAGSFWRAAQELPSYAQPRFVRVMDAMATTATFKIQKVDLKKQGIDPVSQAGRVYLRQDDGYVPLTASLWDDVQHGRARL
ncbi:MAG TPA: AMP-binding protein [Polyangiaceae bacterium]|nr:AMP-binding protein [Polyangiaceae bacterium]